MSEPITARQFWIRSPGIGEIREGALSGAGPDSVMVETHFSGISRGTEALIFRGEVPPSEYQRMRAPFQEGDFPGPVKYGYSSVGVVVDGPAELRDQMVFCLHPHQDRYLVPASAVTPLPPEVPASRAVLAANMETAVNILWDAPPRVGDRIVVVGAGVVGLLSAWLAARLPAADVTVLDVDPGRRATAESLGLDFSTELPVGTDADLVIHASGQPAGLAAALEAAGVEGTVIEASWYGSRSVSVPLGEAFNARRLTIRSSQVGRVPADRTPRWDHGRRLAVALSLLSDPRLDVLVSGESSFDELPTTMRTLSEGPAGVLCHRIRYRDDG